MNSDRAEMNDVIAFLNTWLDEDEKAASEATSGAWTALDGGVTAVDHQDSDGYTEWPVGSTESSRDRADRVHIARHNPARVLREAAALRQVIDDYRAADGALIRGNYDPNDLGWRGIHAGRDALKTVLVAYAKAAGWTPDRL